MRQVVMDTETTGLMPKEGDRLIEVACIELINRQSTERIFHQHLNPERAVGSGALLVPGISDDFLSEQPLFEDVAEEFLEFIADVELIIHNADFDLGFINHELRRLGSATQDITERCQILDTLALARRLHPGQSNSLDALARSVRRRTIFVRPNDPGPWEFRLDDGRAGYWNGKSPSGTPGGRESVPGRLHDGTGPPSSDRHPRHPAA